MNKLTHALCALLACFGTASAAQDAPLSGFYVTGGVSLTSNALSYDSRYTSTDHSTYRNTTTTAYDQSGVGYQLGVGYRFSEHSALELIALRSPEAKRSYRYSDTDLTTNTTTSGSREDDYIQDTSIALTWLYGVPLSQRLNPYARAGVTMTYSHTDDNYQNQSGTYSNTGDSSGFSTGYLVGLGNDMYFSEEKRAALRTEVMLRTNDGTYSSGALSFTTGLVWNF